MATMTRRLYALASGLDMVDSNNKDDPFHQLVYGLTGKEHVSELSYAEAKAVQTELQERMKLKNHSKPLKKTKSSSVPGMMTIPMQKLAWALAYKLEEFDEKSPSVPANIRLAGAVQKILRITSSPEEPLKWVRFQEGMKLIETLKKYVLSAERKAHKNTGDG